MAANSLDEKRQSWVRWILACRDEAKEAKHDRMRLNRENFDMYHLRQDFTHKKAGQSTEVLSKQSMAVEQITSFFQQSLVDMGEWFKIDADFPENIPGMVIKPAEMEKVLSRQLEDADYYSHVGNSIKSALLGALKISKIGGRMSSTPKFIVSKKKRGKKTEKVLEKIDDKAWQLSVELVRQVNYYPDPTTEGLYEIEEAWMDLYKVQQLADGDDAIYDKSQVAKLVGTMSEPEDVINAKRRETDQNTVNHGHRGRVKITEFWGNVLDISTGELLDENVLITMANDTTIIRDLRANPNWNQESPFNIAGLIDVPHAMWPKALMDGPTKYNIALNEIYNLILDGAMKAVHSVTQIRSSWLKDPSQVTDGIFPGMALDVNDQAPPGMKAMENIDTGDVPQDALNVMNIVQQEFNAASLTNDLRQGVVPFRQVKATEVVEASQTITSVFQGMAKNYEGKCQQKELALAWQHIAQNWDKLDPKMLESLFGKSRGQELAALDPADVFADTVQGTNFRVFGISMTLNRQLDFRKLTALLQTISSSEVLIEEFVKRYDFGKLMEEILTSLDIDKHKIRMPEESVQQMAQSEQGGPDLENGAQPGAVPNEQSQIPQSSGGSVADIFAGGPGGIPQANFPPSSASG